MDQNEFDNRVAAQDTQDPGVSGKEDQEGAGENSQTPLPSLQEERGNLSGRINPEIPAPLPYLQHEVDNSWTAIDTVGGWDSLLS